MNARTFGYVVSEMGSGTRHAANPGAIGRIANVLQKRSFVRQPHARKMGIPT